MEVRGFKSLVIKCKAQGFRVLQGFPRFFRGSPQIHVQRIADGVAGS